MSRLGGYAGRVAQRNGKRTPPRPSIEISAPGASPDEAAAIATALEQFLEETAPSPQDVAPGSRWQRAALREGVEARAGLALRGRLE